MTLTPEEHQEAIERVSTAAHSIQNILGQLEGTNEVYSALLTAILNVVPEGHLGTFIEMLGEGDTARMKITYGEAH